MKRTPKANCLSKQIGFAKHRLKHKKAEHKKLT